MFLLSLILGTSIAYSDNHSYQMCDEWVDNIKPDILLCDRSPTDMKNINKAIEYWENEGFEFGNSIRKENYKNECKNLLSKPRVRAKNLGLIIFAGEHEMNTSTHYGLTMIYKRGYLNEIQQASTAIVMLDENYANNVNLIKHELGHALGICAHWPSDNHNHEDKNLNKIMSEKNKYLRIP